MDRPAGERWHMRKPWHYVRDVEGEAWHIAATFGYLPAHRTWTLCGLWPRRDRGWTEVTTDATGVIHSTCGVWARRFSDG